jgi:hypothetical protein
MQFNSLIPNFLAFTALIPNFLTCTALIPNFAHTLSRNSINLAFALVPNFAYTLSRNSINLAFALVPNFLRWFWTSLVLRLWLLAGWGSFSPVRW